MKNYFSIILLGTLMALVGCQQSDKWTVNGRIADTEGDTLTIKHLVNNTLAVVHTKVLKSSGEFKFMLEKREFPEYYFLQVNNGPQLLVMRDSSDRVTITADKANIKNATIEGSEVAVRIQDMEQHIGKLRLRYVTLLKEIDNYDVETQQQMSDEFLVEYNAVKAHIGQEIYKNPKSYYSYYALFQRVGSDNLLFSPYNESDYKYFAAVATAYDLYYKNDPRSVALYEMVEGVIAERRKAKLQKLIDDAPSGLPDIVMKDLSGVEKKLSDLNGKVVILNFWASKSQESRQLNRELLTLYMKYKSRGLAVYQVSADRSKILWEQAIEQDQLPWTNVCDFKEGASRAFMSYNVQQVPLTFLIGRDGKMIGKVTTVEELEKGIKKAL